LYCFKTADVLEQSPSDQLQKVKAERWILKIELRELAVADGEQFSTFDTCERERASLVGGDETNFADSLTRLKVGIDFDETVPTVTV
jgi:hypothetical protein